MNKELPKNFETAENEEYWYKVWRASGFFNPDNLDLPDTAPAYTIILPPPNITDKLHMGHASELAIQDLFIRYKRLRGFRTLWLPGTDHAAIATQTAVEKKIKKEQGLSRHDLGRAEFLKQVWAFLHETQSTILSQMEKMGASLDWSRLAFTLDDDRRRAVREMFIKMYAEGLIYRGERIVNWCPRCQSTLADDEVEHETQAAKLYTFKYDAAFPIAISTTRPETKLGDTAIAVNPKDARYQQYIGQTLAADFCGIPLKLKIIADYNVDMEFGTGALGVTPAHSMVDWQMAEENGLPIIKVINEDAKIHPGFGPYSGLGVLEARAAIVDALNEHNLMISEEDISNNLSVCYRCGTAIEPLPSMQWFIAVGKPLERLGGKSLKQLALEAATSGEIDFNQARFAKKYTDWMANLRDWCISRQIWFGHEIPAWHKGSEIYVGAQAPDGEGWIQDSDTLDTWFSSGMWTFSTLGWPASFEGGRKSGDLARFHPTQTMAPGYELITLWVSRMVMMSYYALGEKPFEKVYLHGMVLDKQGKKMSKSKGNGIDPLDMIALYGTDAVRLSLTAGTTAGNDLKFYQEKVEESRNFVNKLWNIGRFIISQIEDDNLPINSADLTLADRWILSRFERAKSLVTASLENYEYGQAIDILKEFTWDQLADWYLEASKFSRSASTPAILKLILEELLAMWHPFAPFVTESLWSYLDKPQLLMVSGWPAAGPAEYTDAGAERQFEQIIQAVTAIREARSSNKIEPAKKLPALLITGQTELFNANSILITSLRTGLSELQVTSQGTAPAEAIFAKTASADIYLSVPVDREQEKVRLSKESADTKAFIERLDKQLANEEFVHNAPPALVAKERARLAEAQTKLQALAAALEKLD